MDSKRDWTCREVTVALSTHRYVRSLCYTLRIHDLIITEITEHLWNPTLMSESAFPFIVNFVRPQGLGCRVTMGLNSLPRHKRAQEVGKRCSFLA